MDRPELQTRLELLNCLLLLGGQVDRLFHQDRRAATALSRFKDAVALAKHSELSVREAAALASLANVLSMESDPVLLWSKHGTAIEKEIESLEEMEAGGNLLEGIALTAHHWRNQVPLIISEEECEATFRTFTALLNCVRRDIELPEIESLCALLDETMRPQERWQRLLNYFSVHKAALDGLRRVAQASFVRWNRYAVGQQRDEKYRYVLVVEDDDQWREEIKRVAIEASIATGNIIVEAVSDCMSAREFIRGQKYEGTITISDIGLPATLEEKEAGLGSEKNGWDLIQELSTQSHVMAMTSISHLDRDFLALGNSADDFLLKEADNWRDDLKDRLNNLLSPRPLSTLPVTVPAFDAHRIRVGGVWVYLKPLAFAVVDALASGYPASPDQYFEMSPRYWEPHTSVGYLKPSGLTIDQLKIVICRREVTDLRSDFMEAFNKEQLREHLSKIRVALKEAFSPLGFVIDPDEFITTVGVGDAERFQLAAPSRVCNSPEEFFDATSSYRGAFRALIVEDDPVWSDRIEQTLTKITGAEVYAARNYEEALNAAMSKRPHLVALDLNIPKGGETKPEHGVALREELSRLLGQVSFVVMTAFDIPVLRKALMRIMPGTELASIDDSGLLRELRRRVQAKAIFLKQDGDAAVKGLLIQAWRIKQELITHATTTQLPKTLHDVVVNANAWGLRINGTDVRNTARTKENRERDHALIKLLALYPNVPMRIQAVVDYWAESGVLDDVNNPPQRLAERVEHLRKRITKSVAGLEGQDIIATFEDGYAMLGNVTLLR